MSHLSLLKIMLLSENFFPTENGLHLVVQAGRKEVEEAREQEQEGGIKINPLLCRALEMWH